jgi:hypothetical protein
MPGLDAGIHDELQQAKYVRPFLLSSLMDCRAKPGNDSGEAGPDRVARGRNGMRKWLSFRDGPKGRARNLERWRKVLLEFWDSGFAATRRLRNDL